MRLKGCVPILIITVLISPLTTWAAEGADVYASDVLANFTDTDKQMNAEYKEAMKCLNPQDQKVLREGQRAWLTYRDSQGKLTAASYGQGSDAPVAENGEKASLTESRISDLKYIVSNCGNYK